MINSDNLFSQTPKQISSQYQKITGKPLQSTDAGFAYDAMWVIAIALNRTEQYLRRIKSPLSIDNYTYTDQELVEHFKRAIEGSNVSGVTVSTCH